MKKYLNKKTICLTAAALALAGAVSVGGAMAYFTTYATAGGGATLRLGSTTTIPNETVSDWTKHVSITNNGDMECYVRVRAFAGQAFQDALRYSDAEGKWAPGDDGYYYYSDPVPAGGSTGELLIAVDNLGAEEDFNVIVVQESTPVLYDEDGSPYADWDNILDSGEAAGDEGGGQQ